MRNLTTSPLDPPPFSSIPPQVPRLLRGLFPDLYPVRKLLIDHFSLTKPKGITESVIMDISVSEHLFPRRAIAHLWRGFVLEAKGDLGLAAEAYSRAKVPQGKGGLEVSRGLLEGGL